MNSYSLTHLADPVLLRDLAALVARDRTTTAALLAHLAEVDARRLYLPAAYPSMFDYCVGELRLSEDAACKRIRAARTARMFPALFAALADGRLHLSAVVMLAPHLAPETADELVAAAAHKSKAQIEELLAQRFPQPDLPAQVRAIAPRSTEQRAESVELSAPGRIESAARARLAPLAPERFALQVTVGQVTHDKLRYAQELLSHSIPPGDLAAVLDRALDALIDRLEKRKFAKTSKPRQSRRHSSARPRHISATIKRAVWERDGGQCTFVSAAGHRCSARTFLEFDHIDEVARGGGATARNIRLRCRAHNQHGAECTFGTEFMSNKREEARRVAAKTRAEVAAAKEADQAKERDVIPWLRQLGFRLDEARRAAAFSETIPDAPLEERVRVALSYFRPRPPSGGRTANSLGTAA
jgi:hypothetical protein